MPKIAYNEPQEKRQAFEYRFEIRTKKDFYGNLIQKKEEFLNYMGQMGWELCTAIEYPNIDESGKTATYHFYFKRAIL